MRLRRLAMVLATLAAGASLQAEAQPTAPRQWTLTRTLSIGGDGSDAGEFLRVAGVFRLNRGLIAVVNGGTHQVRVFDAAGRYLTAFGRNGDGPGEFRQIGWTGRSGDTLFVSDASSNRITILLAGPAIRLGGTTRITARGGRGFLAGRLADGRWVLTTGVTPNLNQPGLQRFTSRLGLVNSDGGGDIAWLGEFPSATMFTYDPTGRIQDRIVGPAPYSTWLKAEASASAIWFGSGDSDSVQWYDPARGTIHTVRLPVAPRPLDPALTAAARERAMQSARRSEHLEAIWTRGLPRQLPAFASLRSGPGGEVWVQEFNQDLTAASRWLVLGADGAVRATVMVPARATLWEIGSDWVTAVLRDDDDVETVQVYRLQRR